MDLIEEFEDENVGIYRCHDLGSSLAIKVSVSNKGSADPQTEEVVIQWQQKLYSPAEVEQYCSLESPTTELQRRFKEEALRLRAAAQPPSNIVSTRIHGEEFIAQYERSRELMKPALPSSRLAETVLKLRYRPTPPRREDDQGVTAEPGPGPEPDQEPSDQPTLTSVEQRLSRLSLCRTETMLIMLSAEDEEHVLCRLDWSQSGVLTVRPDFSPGSQPYRLQAGEGQKGLYAYRLQWAAPAAQEDGRPAELSGTQTQPAPPRPLRRPAAGPAGEFRLPPVGTLLLALSGELVSAAGFHGDNLFVHFFIDLPLGWRVAADSRLSGITQLCRAPEGREAHFGFPITAELSFTPPEDDTAVYRWPSLYLEVLSEDALGLTRTEGYCHLVLPAAPGHHHLRLAAWRPVGSREAQLRRHFIGGSPELEDPAAVGVPADFQGGRLSRYGLCTETTGWVRLRLSALHQSQGWAVAPPPASATAGAAAVLEAFRRARLRMLRARQLLEGARPAAGH